MTQVAQRQRAQVAPTPNYSAMLGNAVNTFAGIQQAQNQAADRDRDEQIRAYTMEAMDGNPDAMRNLIGLDPVRGARVQSAVDSNTARFKKERAEILVKMNGKSQDEQEKLLYDRIQTLKKRGSDPTHTENLFDIVARRDVDPEAELEVQGIINEGIEIGKASGVLKAPKESTFAEKMRWAGYTDPNEPGAQEYARKISKGGGTSVVVNNAKQGEEGKKLSGFRAEDYRDTQKNARRARASIQNLDIMDNIDVKQGRGEIWKQKFAGVLTGLGIDASLIADVAAGDAYTAASGRQVVDQLGNLSGAASDNDVKMLRDTVASLDKDPRANKFINNSARATYLYIIERDDFNNKYLASHTNKRGEPTLAGVETAWSKHVASRPPIVSRYMRDGKSLPKFWHEFKSEMQAKYKNVKEKDIIKFWHQSEAAAKRAQGKKRK